MNDFFTSIIMQKKEILTPIGNMIAVADSNYLYMLQFTQFVNIKKQLFPLEMRNAGKIEFGANKILLSIESELKKYFAGDIKNFTTPVKFEGSDLQNLAWRSLQTIEYGESVSYKEQANIVGKPRAVRAIANANASNKLSIIVPCHRVIKADGNMGGYSGGGSRKSWLLSFEKEMLLLR